MAGLLDPNSPDFEPLALFALKGVQVPLGTFCLDPEQSHFESAVRADDQ